VEREAVVSCLASLTDEERDAVLAEAVQRAHPWHRRAYNNRLVCARLVGDRYLLADTDDPAKADAVHAEVGWLGDYWWVEEAMQKID
jgi:hypothetical protein